MKYLVFLLAFAYSLTGYSFEIARCQAESLTSSISRDASGKTSISVKLNGRVVCSHQVIEEKSSGVSNGRRYTSVEFFSLEAEPCGTEVFFFTDSTEPKGKIQYVDSQGVREISATCRVSDLF